MIICSYTTLRFALIKTCPRPDRGFKKKEVKKMATVITVPRDSSLQFRLVVGTNPVTGAPIINSKTFAKIKSAALEQDAYDVATALTGLQKYSVDEIRFGKESQLTE